MTRIDARDRLIVALDVPSAAEAEALVDRMGDQVRFVKVGLELYGSGPGHGADVGRPWQARVSRPQVPRYRGDRQARNGSSRRHGRNVFDHPCQPEGIDRGRAR